MSSGGASPVVRITDEQVQQSAPKFENIDTVFIEKTSGDGTTVIKLRKPDESWTNAIGSTMKFKKIGIEFDTKQNLVLRITNDQDQQSTTKFENIDTVYLEKISDDGATAITVRKADEYWIKAIDNVVKFKKIGVELEAATDVGPSVTDADWTSEAWSRKERTIRPGETDPEDSRIKLLKVGDPPAKATIGNGEFTLRGGSPRLYINGEYQNVEFATELFVLENTSQCYLSARSNHEDRPNGFGGYPLYLDITPDKQAMFFKKEQTHKIGYSSRLASVRIPNFVPGKWFKARVRIINIEDGKVKLEGWFDVEKYTSLIDEGQISCGSEKDGTLMKNTPPFTGIGKSCFFRVNGNQEKANVNVKYRNVKIRKF